MLMGLISLISGVFINLFSAFIGFLIGTVFSNRKIIRLFFQSILRKGKNLRLSTAYLFRIKEGNKYILIKGNRINQFQPVGGVYKYYDSFNEKKRKMELVDENESHFFEGNDLRLKTKGQHLSEYIKWFDSRKNREVNVYRELIEELEVHSDKEISIVLNTEIEYIETIKEEIKFSEHFKMDEQLIFDIFEVRLPKNVVEKIRQDDRFVFVEENDIRCECVKVDNVSFNVARTAKYIV